MLKPTLSLGEKSKVIARIRLQNLLEQDFYVPNPELFCRSFFDVCSKLEKQLPQHRQAIKDFEKQVRHHFTTWDPVLMRVAAWTPGFLPEEWRDDVVRLFRLYTK